MQSPTDHEPSSVAGHGDLWLFPGHVGEPVV
jgi:hypothetical protein